MSATSSALPAFGLNPDICAQDLYDLEVDIRYTVNFMLDADETDKKLREAGRSIIRRFLEELKLQDTEPRQALLDFVARTQDLVESAAGRLVQVRAASAKCLLELWTARTRVLTPEFQRVFAILKGLSGGLPRPNLWDYQCFRALLACPALPGHAPFWGGLYPPSPKGEGRTW